MDTISYKEAAADFDSAFPIGNGRLGATVFGGVNSQVIALNEESLWSSPFVNRVNKSCWKDYTKIQELYAGGFEGEARERIQESVAPVTGNPACYKSAGTFRIDFFSSAERTPLAGTESSILVYERKLDMETGIASETVSIESPRESTAIFSQNAPLSSGSSVSCSRDVFASACDDVIVIHIGASLPRNIFLRAGFESDGETRTVFSLDDDTIVLERTNGIPMCAMAMASTTGGSCCVKGGSLIIEGADDVTIYIDIETAYRSGHYRRRGGDVSRAAKSLATSAADRALKKLCFAQTKPYQSVRDDHASRFSRRYRRLSLQLADTEQELAWKYERYRLLSSFTELGSLPALQTGLWSRPCSGGVPGSAGQTAGGQPGTGGQDTRTGGQQTDSLRYRFQDLYGLPYCEYGMEKAYAALSRFIKAFKKRSFRCAKEMFQLDGSLAYGTSDLWGDSAPSCADTDFFAPFGAVYVALALKKYYDYTLDVKFLKKHFKLLTGPCEFFAAFKPPRPYAEAERELIRQLFEAAWDAAGALDRRSKYPEINSYLTGLPGKEDTPAEADRDAGQPAAAGAVIDAIIQARIKRGKVEIDLLAGNSPQAGGISVSGGKFTNSGGQCPNSGGNFPISGGNFPISGELKGLHLPGNLRAEVVWENGSPKGGRIYAKPNCLDYAKSIVLRYGGKTYPSDIQTGSIDILNILPSTV
ncbi:MAG: glycoside hydrolase family 95 protein [Treponema sp.]|nr:glycoside hydrolase family 95 protein [Treponema sp.]